MTAAGRRLRKRRPGTAPSTSAKRRAARLVAIQALYQLVLNGGGPVQALRDQLSYSGGENLDGEALVPPDTKLSERIVLGVHERRDDIDGMIEGALNPKRDVGRLDTVLRVILQAGVWEILAEPQTDLGIIVNDYLEITHGFYDGQESRLVNAVLDRLGKVLRDDGG